VNRPDPFKKAGVHDCADCAGIKHELDSRDSGGATQSRSGSKQP
jgi:hypothetical protein